MSLGAYAVSDDGALLAYSTDSTGFRQYTLFVKDLRTGEAGPAVGRRRRARWPGPPTTARSSTRSRTRPSGPIALYRHRLGAAEPRRARLRGAGRALQHRGRPDAQPRVPDPGLGQPSPRPRCGACPPTTRRASGAGRAPHPRARVRRRPPRRPSSTSAPTTPAATSAWSRRPSTHPGRENWAGGRPPPAGRDAGGRGLLPPPLRPARARGRPAAPARHRPRPPARRHRIAFPEPAYSAFPGANAEFDTADVPLQLPVAGHARARSSTTTWTRARPTLLKEQPVLGGYDRDAIRLGAPASRRRRTAPRSRSRSSTGRGRRGTGPRRCSSTATAPTGYPLPVTFSSNRLSLLDRGMAVALAHIRGGGEMGKPWHDDGRMMKKRNTFTDFIAAAEHLIARGLHVAGPPRRSRAAAPAACSWARSRTCGPTCSGPSSPRCRSWT